MHLPGKFPVHKTPSLPLLYHHQTQMEELQRQIWETKTEAIVLRTKLESYKAIYKANIRRLLLCGQKADAMLLIKECMALARMFEIKQVNSIELERSLCPLTMRKMGIVAAAFCLPRVVGFTNENTRRSWLVVNKQTNSIASYMKKRIR